MNNEETLYTFATPPETKYFEVDGDPYEPGHPRLEMRLDWHHEGDDKYRPEVTIEAYKYIVVNVEEIEVTTRTVQALKKKNLWSQFNFSEEERELIEEAAKAQQDGFLQWGNYAALRESSEWITQTAEKQLRLQFAEEMTAKMKEAA